MDNQNIDTQEIEDGKGGLKGYCLKICRQHFGKESKKFMLIHENVFNFCRHCDYLFDKNTNFIYCPCCHRRLSYKAKSKLR